MADTFLCPELLDKIFSFLESKDLLKASEVSETWNSIARLSLKRRLFLQVHDVDPEDETYALKFREREPQGPAKLIDVDEDDKNIEESDLENLKFDGQLWIPLGSEAHKNLPLLAILFMHDSWALRIKKLDFYDYGDSEDVEHFKSLAVQDWNIAGTHVLSKFPCLKQLNLLLKWIPNYVSTLEVPVVPEGIFDSIEKISIRVLGSQHCQDLNLQFATWCPNLKKFEVIGYDESHDVFFFAKFNKLEEDKQLELLAYRDDKISPPVWEALVPVVKTPPFTLLKLVCSVETLKHFDASVAANVKTLRVILHSNTVKVVAKDVGFVLAALQNRGFSAVEDLQLHWTETDGEDSVAHGKNAVETDFTIPSVKRLELGGIDLSWEDADWCSTNKRLLKALLNVELLVVFCDEPMHNLNPEKFQCSTRYIYPIQFLKYSSEFKQLRHLVWDWDFCRKNRTELRRLRKIPKYLAGLKSLESLTITLAGSKPLPALEAVLNGCAAQPRLRLLRVHSDFLGNLDQSREYDRLKSQFRSFCIQMVHKYNYWDCNDFQIDHLDRLCEESEPPDGISVYESARSLCIIH